MHVFVRTIGDTGLTRDLADEPLVVLTDCERIAETVNSGHVTKLRWTKRTFTAQNAGGLVVTKVWVDPWGRRKIRIQFHQIFSDGHFGPRRLIEERHQGRIVRSV